MSIVQVAIPVLRGRRRFHVEKGKRWSLIEHLMLESVARTPATAADLAQRSSLPRRVVVAAFIRLMRAGWVELTAGSDGLSFVATDSGQAQIKNGSLQALTVTTPRWMGFLIDQVSGSVFRRSESAARHRNELAKLGESLVYLQKSRDHDKEDLAELFAALEGEDEVIVRVEASPDRFLERFAVVTVVNDTIEGLPARANSALCEAIRSAAAQSLKKSEAKTAVSSPPESLRPSPTAATTTALFEQNDLLIDAQDHSSAFDRALAQAREEVIIHSTFISEKSIPAILPKLIGAASKGTIVCVMWGQDDDGTSVSSSRRAVAALQGAIDEAGWGGQIRIHSFTTRSHAKLLIADDGKGQWSAIVGSCNWLSSDFDSFESSVRVREPALVGQLVRYLASMSLGSRRGERRIRWVVQEDPPSLQVAAVAYATGD